MPQGAEQDNPDRPVDALGGEMDNGTDRRAEAAPASIPREGRSMDDLQKMLDFVKRSIASGGVGDTRAGEGLLVLQLKYFRENADLAEMDVRDALEELDRQGKICLFAMPEGDLGNVVVQLPSPE